MTSRRGRSLARKIARPALLAGTFASTPVAADNLVEQQEIPLWPEAAPGSESVRLNETITDRSSDPERPDRVVTGVARPSLTVHLPAKPNGAALIVASGGGYQREVIDKEGSEIADWFVPRGVTVFLLKYRLPSEGHVRAAEVPLQDGQRAVRLVRQRARGWNLDPSRIALMGFSAAGHLASAVATEFERKVYEPVDEADQLEARPDAVILLYPVISMENGVTHSGSRRALLGPRPTAAGIAAHSTDRHVTPKTPPTLIISASDDASVSPEHGIRFYRALQRAGVPAELHIYMQGGHGFGIRKTQGLPVAGWPEIAWTWLGAVGMIPADRRTP